MPLFYTKCQEKSVLLEHVNFHVNGTFLLLLLFFLSRIQRKQSPAEMDYGVSVCIILCVLHTQYIQDSCKLNGLDFKLKGKENSRPSAEPMHSNFGSKYILRA